MSKQINMSFFIRKAIKIVEQFFTVLFISLFIVVLFFSHACTMKLECLKDKDCSKSKPWCVAGVCKECFLDSHCSGKRCDLEKLTCFVFDGSSNFREDTPKIPDGFDCFPTSKRSCYTGAQKTRKRGICKDGYQICSSRGRWGRCVGQQLPKKEECNNLDDDCDGSIDEGIKQKCFSQDYKFINVGVCRAGIQRCQRGHWSSCRGEILPSKEVCDKKDNDCDGEVDEGLHCSP